jgi:TRAP transporter 4TM/12TM fusion protein
VLLMATVPTILYYLSLFIMVELDTRKFGIPDLAVAVEGHLALLTKRYWYHFVSLVAIVAFMVWGFSPMLAVFWATVVTFAVSFLRRESAMGWRKVVAALRDGSGQMLNVAATCAAAGIIVGVVSKTGLGLKFSAIVISYAGGSLLLTAVYTALIVWVIGLAVPVTASYIICAVIAAPALTKLGVPDFAAHMFIFYYAVLSEVSPPTALSPFAAAAITGGDPYRTTLQAWKYTLPAFIVPFVFVLDPSGVGLLLKRPADGSWIHVAWIAVTACVGIVALAAGTQKWLLSACNQLERWTLIVCGLLLVYPAPAADVVGLVGFGVILVLQTFARRRAKANA